MPRTSLSICSIFLLALASPTARAQTATVTYDLVDVWLLPDVTHPTAPARQMTGAFEWSYTVGDFENGSGEFVELYIPWWGTRTFPELESNIQIDGIEITMIGNYHGFGLDVNLRPATDLSPLASSPLDTVRSRFEVEVGIGHRGHAIRGSLVPRCSPAQAYGNGSPGTGGHVPQLVSNRGLPNLGNPGFRVEADRFVGGAPCMVLLGTSRTQLSLVNITLLVDPTTALFAAFRASGAQGVPGVGALQVPLPIPNEPLLVGVELDVQILGYDPSSTFGPLSATNGLAVRICG